jgi:hypothetical protein
MSSSGTRCSKGLLILDEHMSELGSAAVLLVAMLSALVRKRAHHLTVVMNVHQPSSHHVYCMFDSVTLLAAVAIAHGGRLAPCRKRMPAQWKKRLRLLLQA